MRPVPPQPEPDDFDHRVRQPGNALVAKRKVSGRSLRLTPFWSHVYREMHDAYGGCCAYTCFYQHDRSTIDHFWPKEEFVELAYEWCNYRLCSPRTNQFKSTQVGILDPLSIRDGLFVLDLPSCQIRPSASLGDDLLTEAAFRTINILHLNDDDYLVKRRADLIVDFAEGHISRQHVRRMNPFIYDELTRQDAWDSIRGLFAPRRQ